VSRVALVTGAASGNGEAIAARFLRDGAAVVAVDAAADGLARAAAAWSEHADRVATVIADVTEPSQIEAAVAAAGERFGRLDVLVNNAGISGDRRATTLHETPIDQWDRVMAVNVRGVFLGCRAALPVMLAQGGGMIVNIASVAGLVAFPGRAAYTTSKGAVIQLTKSIAADYASRGIRANALCPGMVDTPMTHWRLSDPDLLAAVLDRIPQREIGDPSDVADAVAFLAGPEARQFNGAAIVMDGGWTAI
jgi:NAD(P)-dependent dehydrogenase (short-subunit alcohol dehydrogenase family)